MHPTQTKNIFLLNTVAPFRCQNRRRAHFMFNGCRSTYPWVMVDQPGQRAARIHIISWRLSDPWAVGHMRLVDLQRGCFGLKMLQRWSQFLNALGDFLHGWASRCARQVLFLFACFLSSLIEVDLGFDSNVLRGRDPLLQVILVLHKLLGKLLPIAHGFGEKSFPCLEVSGRFQHSPGACMVCIGGGIMGSRQASPVWASELRQVEEAASVDPSLMRSQDCLGWQWSGWNWACWCLWGTCRWPDRRWNPRYGWSSE